MTEQKAVGPAHQKLINQEEAEAKWRQGLLDKAVRPTGAITGLPEDQKIAAMHALARIAEAHIAERERVRAQRIIDANSESAIAASSLRRITMRQAEEGNR